MRRMQEHMASRAIRRRLHHAWHAGAERQGVWHPLVLERIVTKTAYTGKFAFSTNEAADRSGS